MRVHNLEIYLDVNTSKFSIKHSTLNHYKTFFYNLQKNIILTIKINISQYGEYTNEGA